jgi:hypothetical protein
MDAKTIASLPPKLLAQYLRDPSLQMAMQMQQEASDTSPVQHWTQGAARLVKGLLGGIQANGIQEQYGKQAQNVATERQMALSQALGRPAETQQVGDRTINWQAQQPNLMSAGANLQSPDNADLAEKFMGMQQSRDSMNAQQAFAQAQQDRAFQQQQAMQERLFAQQQAMNSAQLQKQMDFERFKLENDPQRIMMRQIFGQQSAASQPQATMPPPQAGNQAGIQLGMTRDQATAPQQPMPQQQTQADAYDPRVTAMAMTGGIKLPEGMGLSAQGQIVPIGMPPKAIPAEQAARMALGDVYLNDAPKIRERLQGMGDVASISGAGKRMAMAAGVGEPGQLQLQVQSGADALQRNLTGAGMSNAEADKYVARYVPSATDTMDRLLYKHDQLVKELQATSALVRSQYGQKNPQQVQAQPAPNAFNLDAYLQQRGLQ